MSINSSIDKNLTSTNPDDLWPLEVIIYNLVLFFISFVNLFTCIVFMVAYIKSKSLRSNRFTFFIFHMTLADVLNIVIFLLNLVLDDLLILNDRFMCSFMEYLYYLTFDVSYYLSLLLALERYNSVVKPLYYSFVTGKRFMRASLLAVWLLSSVVLFFMFFVFSKWNDVCISYEILSETSQIVVYFVGTSMTSMISCVLYANVIYVIYERKNRRKLFAENRTVQQINDENQNFNSALVMCILAVILEICRIPYLVTTYLLFFDKSASTFAAYRASIALILIKPVLSFIVYSVKFKEIRQIMKMIISCGRWNNSQIISLDLSVRHTIDCLRWSHACWLSNVFAGMTSKLF